MAVIYQGQDRAGLLAEVIGGGLNRGIDQYFQRQIAERARTEERKKYSDDMGLLAEALAGAEKTNADTRLNELTGEPEGDDSAFAALTDIMPKMKTDQGSQLAMEMAFKKDMAKSETRGKILEEMIKSRGKAPDSRTIETEDENGVAYKVFQQWDPNTNSYINVSSAKRDKPEKVERWSSPYEMAVEDANGVPTKKLVQKNLETGQIKPIMGAGVSVSVNGEQKLIQNEDSLRKEHEDSAVSKSFHTLREYMEPLNSQFSKLQNPKAANSVTLADFDQRLIMSYNKTLDTISAVRESEYLRTADMQSIANKLQGWVEKGFQGGSGLSSDERKIFMDNMNKAYDDNKNRYLERAKWTLDIAKGRGYDSSKVINPRLVKSVYGDKTAALLFGKRIKNEDYPEEAPAQSATGDPAVDKLLERYKR